MVKRIHRRYALKGIGAFVSLPLLEAMIPLGARASETSKPPVRLVWLYAGSGMYMPTYKPALLGKNWTESNEMPADTLQGIASSRNLAPELKPLATLQPLLPFKDDVSILSGLIHTGAFTRGAVGRHSQDPMCHLTGVDLFRVPGVAVRNGVSVDQVAARHLGQATRIPSLALTHDRNMTINYSESGSPIPCDSNPSDVFQRLFTGSSAVEQAQAELRFQQKKSVLDAVISETRSLHQSLGTADRARLDEYLTQLREIEARTAQARQWDAVPLPKVPGNATLSKVPVGDFGPQIRLMLDVLVLALQTDQTRVATAILGHMGDVYKEDKFTNSYHGYTHGISEAGGQISMSSIDRLRIGHVAYLLGKMKAIHEGDGSTLLDNSLVHFGGGMGTWHESTDLANLIAGHGGGKFKLGEHLAFTKTPLANLYVTMLQTAGVPVKSFADGLEPLSLS